jgi:Mg2+ and Co2+ transporter CorA
VGFAAYLVPGEGDRPSRVALIRELLRGYLLTPILGAIMLFLPAVGISRKARSIRHGWSDAHIPIVAKPGGYDQIVSDLQHALTTAGVPVEAEDEPAVLSAPAWLLTSVARGTVRKFRPDRLVELSGPNLRIGVYPSDIAISGPTPERGRARAAILSRLATTAAHLTTSAEAQAFEDRLEALVGRQMSAGPRDPSLVSAEFEPIDAALLDPVSPPPPDGARHPDRRRARDRVPDEPGPREPGRRDEWRAIPVAGRPGRPGPAVGRPRGPMTATITARPDRAASRHPDPDASAAAVTIRLFDADRSDDTLDLGPALQRQLNDRQLLWIDVEGELDPATADLVAQRMDLNRRTRNELVRAPDGPFIALHGAYFHLRVATEADHDATGSPGWLDLIAAKGIVVSSHREPVASLRGLDERIERDTTVGSIDGGAFVRAVLDAVVTGYFRAVDAIEDAVDDLDGRALRRRAGDEVLVDLVALRRRIARLRRVLSDQREVFAALGAADFGAANEEDETGDYRPVVDRFENALRSVEDTRDLLLGSFDVFMTRTAQRTNEVMKVLALATVLLLPGSLIAGLLGMNVEIPLPKDGPISFWLVVVSIVTLAVGVLVVARARRWI